MIRRRTAALVAGAAALSLGFLVQSGPAIGAGLPARASAYVRADAGLPTFNPDVNSNSSCATPDTFDLQRLSPAGATTNNVHIDACLFSSAAAAGANRSDVDVPATFELSGVGTFSACPDPDGAGPKTAVRHDHDGDGNFEHCHQSGYQSTGTGALEYHARVNNSVESGQTRVVFCYDATQNGCRDETVRSLATISWSTR